MPRRLSRGLLDGQVLVSALCPPQRASISDATWCILASMGKIRMNIYLNGGQKKVLEKLSAKTGAPVAELIRRAVDAYVKTRRKELK